MRLQNQYEWQYIHFVNKCKWQEIQGGWTSCDSYPKTNLMSIRVHKCPFAHNVQGLDFYHWGPKSPKLLGFTSQSWGWMAVWPFLVPAQGLVYPMKLSQCLVWSSPWKLGKLDKAPGPLAGWRRLKKAEEVWEGWTRPLGPGQAWTGWSTLPEHLGTL